MSNAEDYILEDGDTELLSSDGPMAIFTGVQNNSPEIDELHQLLGETFTREANDSETMISTEYDSSFVVDEHAVSALEELEELYGVSGETGVDDADVSLEADDSSTGDVSGATSLMAEMEALYGNSVETEIDNTETTAETEESADEDTSDSVSLMEELEELFSSSTESADTEFSLQTSEQSSVEEDDCSMSALDELRAFLGDTTQAEAGDTETSSVSTLEHSLVSRRSVLDELQDLLQSCIDELKADELKADIKNTIDDTSVFTDAVYPSRDELQNLLENILSQLMLFSNSSVATTSTDSISVLDELKNFMYETGGADKTEASTESGGLFTDDDSNTANENEAVEYEVSSFNEEDGMEDMGSDSIIDELNLLLDNSSSETSDISDESPVMDELTSYMAELSDDTDIDDKTSVEETGADSTDKEVASASNTLEELEAMLNEISVSGNDKTSNSIKVSEDDFSYEYETRQLFDDNKKEKLEDNTELYNKVQTVEQVTDNTELGKVPANMPVEDVDLLHEQDSDNRISIAGLLFATVLAVGGYGFWSWLYTGNGIDDRTEKSQATLLDKTVMDYEKPKTSAWTEQSVVQESEYVPGADSIYDLLAKTEASSYVPTNSYDDEPLSIESTETDIENKVAQKLYEQDAGKKAEAESKEVISVQMKKLQQENRESINQLNKRMIEAEMSIERLQEEKATANKNDLAAPVEMASSEVPEKPELREKPELPVKQEIIGQPEQTVPVIRAQGKDGNLWFVQLSSYYGKPPPASELKYLENAGISYEIKKAMVNEKVWYRVIVDEFSEYEKAKQFSDDIRKNVIRKKVIKKNVIRKDMWINKSQ